MVSWLPAVLLAGSVLFAGPTGGAADAVAVPTPLATQRVMTSASIGGANLPSAGHDFHVSYTRMAVERTVVSAQLRLFADDLVRALTARARGTTVSLDSPQGDAAFRAYVATAFIVTANGQRLTPVVASSAPERDMRSYVITWTAPAVITSLSMHNAALMELFDDQQNIVKVKHIGSGVEATLFYSGGSPADQPFRF